MEHSQSDPTPWNGGDGADILQQVWRHLDAVDRWQGDLATEEDMAILEGLFQAVRAAIRKGYSEELLVKVLHSLFQS